MAAVAELMGCQRVPSSRPATTRFGRFLFDRSSARSTGSVDPRYICLYIYLHAACICLKYLKSSDCFSRCFFLFLFLALVLVGREKVSKPSKLTADAALLSDLNSARISLLARERLSALFPSAYYRLVSYGPSVFLFPVSQTQTLFSTISSDLLSATTPSHNAVKGSAISIKIPALLKHPNRTDFIFQSADKLDNLVPSSMSVSDSSKMTKQKLRQIRRTPQTSSSLGYQIKNGQTDRHSLRP